MDPLVQQRVQERRAAAAQTTTVIVSIDETQVRERVQLLARAGHTAAHIRNEIRRNIQELMVIRSRR